MVAFILAIFTFTLIVLITAINFQYTTTLSLLVYKFEDVPGIILLYIGMVFGAIICIPFLIAHTQKYVKKVLNRSIKTELKRLKTEERKQKKITSAEKKEQRKSKKKKQPPVITKVEP